MIETTQNRERLLLITNTKSLTINQSINHWILFSTESTPSQTGLAILISRQRYGQNY